MVKDHTELELDLVIHSSVPSPSCNQGNLFEMEIRSILSFWGAGSGFSANRFPLGRMKPQGQAMGLPLSRSQVATCPQHPPPVWKML